MNAFFQLLEWLFGSLSAFQRPRKTPPPWSPVEVPEPDPVFPPSTPSTPSPDLPAGTSTDDLRIGLAIVDREARRDAAGNVVIYRLPGNDGGGTHEVAGINSVYHPEMLKKLTGMAPPDREAACAEYIENYTLRMTGLSKSDRLRIGTLYQVLDTTFHRGGGGSAWVVQTSLRTLGYSVIRDRKWGPNTRAALMKADRDFPDSLNKHIRKNREFYERTVVGYRANFWKGFVNRWDGVFALAETWNAETPAPVRVPVTDPMTAPPVETVEPAPVLESLPSSDDAANSDAPRTITLPRESTSSLNAFYGTASKSGHYLTWFSFPVSNVRLYSESGTPLSSRVGDDRDDHRCHKMVAKRLESALQEIYDTIGKEQFEKEGWNIYGGCFNYRVKRGGSSLSTHSWGIAIDVNPGKNAFQSRTTTFSAKAIDIMEKHGFLSGGRAWGKDWMHFQAAIPNISSGSYYSVHGLPKWIQPA